MSGVDFNHLVDIASSIEPTDNSEESMKSIIEAEYPYLASYIDSLYFIESNILFLNYVQNVPQREVAEMFNIKQYGVSKRVASAIKRLSIHLKAPNKEAKDSFLFLDKLLTYEDAYNLTVRYSLKTLALSASVIKGSTTSVTKSSRKSEKLLKEYSLLTDPLEFVLKVIGVKKGAGNCDLDFLDKLLKDTSYFMVIRHTVDTHLQYIDELNRYNSRGSHNFRSEFY